MDGARLSADTRNIPHMQLFIHLKQKFPDLKDNDVNESIQKYGLDRERCEEELSQKTHIHHGGYYGPWGRPGSSLSLTSPSRVTSPIRTGIPPTPTTPVITSSTAVTPLLPHTNATHHVFGPLQSSGYLMYSYGPGMVAGPGPVYTSPNTTTIATSPVLFQPPVNSPADYGWHPSVSNGVRGAAVQPLRHLIGGGSGSGPDTPYSSREASKSRSSTPVLPNSAPVVPNSFDPFSACENHPVLPERRKSAETQFDGRRGLFYNVHNLEQHFERLNDSAHHSPTPPLNNTIDSLSTPITTTTTTITTTTSNCVDPSSSSNSSSVSRPPPALVQEQNLRKEKLNAELAKQIEEKGKLEKEVDMMRRELEWRERQRKQNADRNTKMIEDVQQENQRLQSECYEMENKIFRLAPELEPEYPLHVPSNLPFSEAPLIPQLTRPSSGSSLGGSGTGTPQTPHTPHTPHTSQTPGVFIPPTRPALPPPLPPTSVPNHGYCVVQGVPGDTVDEVGPKWACTKCTFINHPDMNKCEMCDYPRFTIGTAPSNHAAHPPNHQGPCYCHRHHTPGSVAGSIGAAAAYSPDRPYSSLPLAADKPSLANILKEKLIGLRDRSDSV
ncbi:mitogen-activated protein kinase kinase kinase 7-interacting protein 3 homolog isoform X7 [Penaeus chinensis]|uniref:mitogen-activated protein kinase kinase kinase 7-interacting protein 3 homolog isoform X7 n=1 Tax=Penaeus chinensis TaxID=139456 RepID=UPI001FB7C3D8|nr:mitogen-activated protein kinase kinase kinase 7-interacting protein 3 homolog isoform X7 [Penaeus chinensis]